MNGRRMLAGAALAAVLAIGATSAVSAHRGPDWDEHGMMGTGPMGPGMMGGHGMMGGMMDPEIMPPDIMGPGMMGPGMAPYPHDWWDD
jgi:hypothetical protein